MSHLSDRAAIQYSRATPPGCGCGAVSGLAAAAALNLALSGFSSRAA
jgi:hypothetical protein